MKKILIILTLLIASCSNYSNRNGRSLYKEATYVITEIDNRYNIDSLDYAINLLKEAIKKEPQTGRYYSKMGEIYMMKHDKESGLKYFCKGWELYKSDYNIGVMIGSIYHQDGDTINAKKYYKEALQSTIDQRNNTNNQEFDAIGNITNSKMIEYLLGDTISYDNVQHILDTIPNSDVALIKEIIHKTTSKFDSNKLAEYLVESLY